MEKCLVIINEQHSLLPEQKKILKDNYKEIYFLKVPKGGWTLKEMQDKFDEIQNFIWYNGDVIFASPIPYLLLRLAFHEGYWSEHIKGRVRIFHNDKGWILI